jgi:threonine dehydratase
VKVERTRGFGAEVVLHGDTLEEARQHAYLLAEEQNLTFVHPFDDEAVAGQGTLALEMLAVQPDLDTLVVAIGGGGLIAGVATAAKALKPGIRVVGCRRSAFRPWSTPCRARTCPWASPPSPKGLPWPRPAPSPARWSSGWWTSCCWWTKATSSRPC